MGLTFSNSKEKKFTKFFFENFKNLVPYNLKSIIENMNKIQLNLINFFIC